MIAHILPIIPILVMRLPSSQHFLDGNAGNLETNSEWAKIPTASAFRDHLNNCGLRWLDRLH